MTVNTRPSSRRMLIATVAATPVATAATAATKAEVTVPPNRPALLAHQVSNCLRPRAGPKTATSASANGEPVGQHPAEPIRPKSGDNAGAVAGNRALGEVGPVPAEAATAVRDPEPPARAAASWKASGWDWPSLALATPRAARRRSPPHRWYHPHRPGTRKARGRVQKTN